MVVTSVTILLAKSPVLLAENDLLVTLQNNRGQSDVSRFPLKLLASPLPLIVAALWFGIPALAQTAQSSDSPGYSSLEMAATLRDMLALERVAKSFRERMFVLPSEMENTFRPQSAWGRNQQQDYAGRWDDAIGTLLSGLRRRGELADALSPKGLRLPVEKSLFEDVPEYRALDRLLQNVNADICEEESSPPNCYIVILLKELTDQRITLKNLRIVAPDGSLIPIQGKVQQP